GIVSEGDLMRRVEAGTRRPRSWGVAIFTGKKARAVGFIKEQLRKGAGGVTREGVNAPPHTPLSKKAKLLAKDAIKRGPNVEDGKVVGIVSRANLLQALASLSKRAEVATRFDDSQIRNKVLTQLNAEPWTRPSLINVIVQDGTVELWGIVDSASEKKAVRIAA